MAVTELPLQPRAAEQPRLALTADQRAAIEWGDGPLMVLAGAGTGKTTVVVERVRQLLTSDVDLQPENVLVLTYNVKAAAELMDRLESLLGLELASRLWVHNFHSFGQRVLSDHRGELGLPESADVLDGVGQRLLLRELRHEFGHFVYHNIARDPNAAGRFADVIGRAKDELVTPHEFSAFAQARREAFELTHGVGVFEELVEQLRRRVAEDTMWQVRMVRRELVGKGREAGHKRASTEARRDTATDADGKPLWWTALTREQERLAKGLAGDYLRQAEALDVLRLIEEAEAYAIYQRALTERGQLDFGEQQLRAIQLLTERPNIVRRYQEQFRHVLVDEFQDANMAQIMLLELVGRGPGKPDNVVVVGDDDQSIYRFRGASYAAFDEFRRRFEQPPAWAPERTATGVARLALLDNRRSTGHILSAAGRLIERNSRRLKSEPLRAIEASGAPVEVCYATDDADEADQVVAWIKATVAEQPGRRWSDVAVLYRKHRHRELIVERLRRQDIPYVVVGGSGLFAVPDVRDVEAALRVVANPDDSSAFVRLLAAGPWRLDAAEILRLTRAADWDGRPVFQAATDILREDVLWTADDTAAAGAGGELPGIAQTLWADEEFDAEQPATVRERKRREQRTAWRREQLDARLRAKLARVVALLDELVPRAQREGPFDILEDYLVRTNLLHDLVAIETPDAQRSVLAVARFMRFVADWQAAHPRASLAGFVGYLDVYQQVGGDLDADLPGRVDVDGVQLMTVYQAKGLEWDAVVVPRLVEGQFPDTREEQLLIPVELLKQRPPEGFAIDEERRLLYVAMTRARRRLLLSAVDQPGTRTIASRFAAEVAPAPGAHEPPLDDVVVERRAPPPQAEVDAVTSPTAAQAVTATTTQLLKLMPVPLAHEERFRLRRRAVELIGAFETLGPDDDAARQSLTAELVAVAEQATAIADDTRRHGSEQVSLNVLARHAPAGAALLQIAPLPATLSHSQMRAYLECPLAYAFDKVYRIPVAETPGYFEFGHVIHRAFEVYARARRDALAAGQPGPDYDVLRRALADAWDARRFADVQAATHYAARAEPALRRFYERELTRPAEAVDFEVGFTLEVSGDTGETPVRFYGVIDRIDRHPDGSIEIIDYKTGRPRNQRQVDEDDQLSAYALALAMGAVRAPHTGQPLPAASKLTLYFTETDTAVSTTRSDEQLADFRTRLLGVARRIRSGDFTANPDYWRCGRCEYRRICPSREGAQKEV
jgi:DNA helicase-2/ATP-dependent DNA helicase PcrA